MSDGLTTATYVPREDNFVQAIRYRPPLNCRNVWDFMGWHFNETDILGDCWHDPEDCNEREEIAIDYGAPQTWVKPGQWIVFDHVAEAYEVMDNRQFGILYKEMT